MRNKKIFTWVLCMATLTVALLAWKSVEHAISVPGSSTWLVPMVWFASLSLLLSLGFLLIKNYLVIDALILVSLSFSLIFARQIYFVPFIIAAFLPVVLAKNRIQQDLELNIKVNIRKSLRTGFRFFLFGLSILIAAEYYFIVLKSESARVIPKFEMSKTFNFLTPRVLGLIDPNFKNIESENLTVDEFLLQIEKEKMSEQPKIDDAAIDNLIEDDLGYVPAEQKNAIKDETRKKFNESLDQLGEKNRELILSEGRKQFSKMTDLPIKGDEKISDIFMLIINTKIDGMFSPKIDGSESGGRNKLLPAVMAFVLFITVWSIAIVAEFWIMLLASGVFYILVKAGMLTIKKEMQEVEVIE